MSPLANLSPEQIDAILSIYQTIEAWLCNGGVIVDIML